MPLNSIEDYFNGAPVAKQNANGDTILMKDGNKVRFYINNPGNDDPHFYVEKQTPNGAHKDVGPEHRYYFNGK